MVIDHELDALKREFLHEAREKVNEMQAALENGSSESLERVAYECGEDLARDGVVYAEPRYAPVFSTARGLSLEQVVNAVGRGFERAEARYGITLRQIVCAMRDRTDSLEMAKLAIANRDLPIVDLLLSAGADPSFAIGGSLNESGTNAHAGGDRREIAVAADAPSLLQGIASAHPGLRHGD